MNIDILIIKRFIMKVYSFMILCSKFIEQNKLVRKIQYEWISQPIQLLFTKQSASRPCFYFTFSITSFAAISPVLTGATSA